MRRTRTGDKVDEGQKDGEGRVFPQTCAIVMGHVEKTYFVKNKTWMRTRNRRT